MTEQQPEDLYEQLRRKLEDYGSPPPPDLWAGIQRQLPPAASAAKARPALRVRRRWAVAALLFLGLLVGLLVSPPMLETRPVSGPTVAATGPSGGSTRRAAAESAAMGESVSPKKEAVFSGKSKSQSTEEQPIAAVSSSAKTNQKNLPENPEAQHTTAAAATVGGRPKAGAAAAPGAVAAAGSARSRSKTTLLAATPNARRAFPAGTTRPETGKSAATAARNPAGAAAAATQTTPGAALNASPGATAAGSTATLATAAAAGAVARVPESATPAASGATALQPSGPLPAVPDAASLLSAAAAGLYITRLPPLPRPLPLLVLPAPDSTLTRQPSRWAVQLLAGPTLSYRHLSGPDSAAGLARLERPAVAFAGQVQLRYALTPRLHLSGGLGYAEYATRYYLRLLQTQLDTSAVATPVRTYRTKDQRDMYRYFTVPVQVQYQLGRQRLLSYGLTLGATLDWYRGGRSTDCGCSTQQATWTSSGSPYRQLGMSATAGLELRYVLTPRLSVLAQPTLRYSVFSISTADTQPARYPFAAGLLTGLSFDLR